MINNSNAIILKSIASYLCLKQEDEETYYGSYAGYPVAISIFTGADTIVFGPDSVFGNSSVMYSGSDSMHNEAVGARNCLLIQVRFPYDSETLPDEPHYCWQENLLRKITNGVAKVDIEDRLVWLSIYNIETDTDPNGIENLLKDFLAGLQAAGIESIEENCHYCLHERGEIIYLNGRVLQICEYCLDDYLHERTTQSQATGSSIAQAIVGGVIAAAVGSMLWAGFWFTCAWIPTWLSGGIERAAFFIPGILSLIIALGIGALVGYPVGYIVRRIANRGAQVAKIATCCALAGTLLGELLFVSLWTYYLDHEWIFSWRLLWAFWSGAGVIDIITKAVAASLGAIIAYAMTSVETKPI